MLLLPTCTVGSVLNLNGAVYLRDESLQAATSDLRRLL